MVDSLNVAKLIHGTNHMMTSADVTAILKAEGAPISDHAFYYAIKIGAIKSPKRSVTGRYLFDDGHLAQMRAYCNRVRKDGRPPNALLAAK